MQRLAKLTAGISSVGFQGPPRNRRILPADHDVTQLERRHSCRLKWFYGMALGITSLLLAPHLPAQPAVTTNSSGDLVLTNSFGDLNDDSQVDVRDVVLLTHHLNATRLLSTQMVARADLNLDSAANATDRSILANMIACRNIKAEEDFDADELPNAEEVLRATNPLDPDTDHDGWLDGWEAAEATNPLDAQSGLKLFVIARPPVQVIHPLIQDTDTNTLGTVLARPPVQVIHPLIQDTDTFGTVLAQPPVQVIHPLIQDTDTNTLGTALARPPVTVTNPPPQ